MFQMFDFCLEFLDLQLELGFSFLAALELGLPIRARSGEREAPRGKSKTVVFNYVHHESPGTGSTNVYILQSLEAPSD